MNYHLSIVTVSLMTAITVNFTPGSLQAAWVAGASGTAAIMAGTSGDDSITITTEGSFWLLHNRFDAGDPGFVSNRDFDSNLAGEQRIPNNGTGSVALFAGAGYDELFVRDGFLINPNNRLQVEASTIRLGAETNGNRPVITYDNFNYVSLSPQTPFNGGVSVISTDAATTYRIGSRKDQTYKVGDPAAKTLDTIQGPISFDGGWIDLEDTNDTSDNTYTVDSFGITRTGSAEISYYGATSVRLFAGQGHNKFNVLSNNTEDFQLNGGPNTNEFIFGSETDTLDRFSHPVELNRYGGGNDSVIFNDAGSKGPHEYNLVSHSLVRDFNVIAFGTGELSVLYCGPYNDTIWTEPGSRTHVAAGAGPAMDVLVVNCDFASGPITVNGEISTISNPFFQPLTFWDIDHLFVFGDIYDNAFDVTPSPNYPINLDGSADTGAPGDSLKLQAGGQPFILTSNEFLVYGKKLVTFLGFETVEGPPAPPPPPPPPPSAVDLTGNFVAAMLTPKGKKFAITAQFDESNHGTLNAAKTVTQFYLSSDPTLSADDLPLKKKKMKLIPPGQLRTIILKKSVPASAAPAGKFLIAKVDDTNISGDPNPNDNIIVYGPLF